MKMTYRIIGFTLLLFALWGGYGYNFYRAKYNHWEIKNIRKSTIPWAKFEWTSDSISGRYFDKLSINIPAKMQGIPYELTFQFDLGANTILYENELKSIFQVHNSLRDIVKSPLPFYLIQLLKKEGTIEDGLINIGDYQAKCRFIPVKKNYGDFISKESLLRGDTIHIGTIGADFFQNKILIIDYPNKRLAILDEVPSEYKTSFIDIELDKSGRVILPLEINENHYRILFDTGSSLFPIITLSKNTGKFSSNPDIDTLKISSWGVKHDVTGKMITDTFELAGQNFSNVKVYTNHSGLGIDNSTDGMTGNALFWDKTIIIDFKHKKFGVK
jgi:hypothetical protein